MDIVFRNATLDDKEFFFLIRKTTIKPYIEKYAKWNEEKEYSDIISRIDLEHDKIILNKDKEIGLFSVKESNTDIYVNKLNVVPEYQSRGLGTWIISSLIEDGLKKNKCLRLDTYQNNTRAVLFYLRNGFEIVGMNQQKDKYPKILMEYKL